MSLVRPTSNRIASLDQYRGYTVAGMFLVNFIGGYVATPVIFTHQNNFCSYADTIMPQFFFAVGFAFRLTFGRRAQSEGLARAYGHVVRRLLGLALVALVVYNAPTVADTWEEFLEKGPLAALWHSLRGTWFQTLMHIAVTSLWITPVIRAGAGVRIAFMVFSALLQVGPFALVLFSLGQRCQRRVHRHRWRHPRLLGLDHPHDPRHASLRCGHRRRPPAAGRGDRVGRAADGRRLGPVEPDDALRRAGGSGRVGRHRAEVRGRPGRAEQRAARLGAAHLARAAVRSAA